MQLSLFGLLLLTQPLHSSEQHTRANLEFSSDFGFTQLYFRPLLNVGILEDAQGHFLEEKKNSLTLLKVKAKKHNSLGRLLGVESLKKQAIAPLGYTTLFQNWILFICFSLIPL